LLDTARIRLKVMGHQSQHRPTMATIKKRTASTSNQRLRASPTSLRKREKRNDR